MMKRSKCSVKRKEMLESGGTNHLAGRGEYIILPPFLYIIRFNFLHVFWCEKNVFLRIIFQNFFFWIKIWMLNFYLEKENLKNKIYRYVFLIINYVKKVKAALILVQRKYCFTITQFDIPLVSIYMSLLRKIFVPNYTCLFLLSTWIYLYIYGDFFETQLYSHFSIHQVSIFIVVFQNSTLFSFLNIVINEHEIKSKFFLIYVFF